MCVWEGEGTSRVNTSKRPGRTDSSRDSFHLFSGKTLFRNHLYATEAETRREQNIGLCKNGNP